MTSLSQALSLYRHGDLVSAARLCEQLLRESPDDIAALTLLGDLDTARGNHAAAASCHRRLTALRPDDAAGWRRLGASELAGNRFQEAVQALQRSLQLEPESRRGHNNLGLALLQSGDAAGAVPCFRAALDIDPEFAAGHCNLGIALAAVGDGAGALHALRQALRLEPGLAPAHSAMATLLAQRCAWQDALQNCEDALRYGSRDPELPLLRATILLSMERAAEALAAADVLLAGNGRLAAAHNLRGGALRRLGRHMDALAALDRAVAIDATLVDAWSNRGMVLHELGEVSAAADSYRRAIALEPTAILPRTRLLARLIPAVPASAAEAMAARRRFEAELVGFESWLASRTLGEADALLVAEQQFFYLSYDAQSNRGLLARYRAAAAARLASYPQPAVSGAAAPRLRIGFVSAHVHDHSVYNALLRGWLKGLSRRRFELVLFSLGATDDAATREAARAVDRFECGARPTLDWARCIVDAGCDVLIYPELGMNSQCLGLAAMRLAQRQFVAWGHPETSGLPTIDGFLSAEAFEPDPAQEHYTERLWRLPRLGVHCQAYGVEPEPVDIHALGLGGHGPVLVCPGVPQKYRPQDDAVLVQIARRLGRCRLIFFQAAVAQQSHRLIARIGAAFTAAGLDPAQFLVLLPWQPRGAFFGLLQAADVYLDTLGFSGFNTLMQAVECGLPCVALEGEYLRGRLGSGILRTLGLDELVAATAEGYVDVAVRLAADPALRREVRARLVAGREALWNDSAAVDALARILEGTATDSLRP